MPYVPTLDAPEVVGVIRDGEDFVLSDLPQKLKLVFFGYTACPDICPLTLSNLRSVYDQLTDSQRSDVAVVLISLDPSRDTSAILAAYAEAFIPASYGVHVPEDALAQTLSDFNVFSAKRSVTEESGTNSYLIDHTAVIFVIDGKNQLREIFSSNAPADQIVADVRYLLSE
jgi:protein SCO1/2